MRRELLAMLLIVSFAACARSRESSPRVATVEDSTTSYLRDVRASFARAANEPPSVASSTLAELRARELPTGLDANDALYIRLEIDRELALVALDAGDIAAALVAVERGLTLAESEATRDREQTAALMLVAERVYSSAGREDAARLMHAEAEALLR